MRLKEIIKSVKSEVGATRLNESWRGIYIYENLDDGMFHIKSDAGDYVWSPTAEDIIAEDWNLALEYWCSEITSNDEEEADEKVKGSKRNFEKHPISNEKFIKICKKKIAEELNSRFPYINAHKGDIYTVWMCKILENNKALFSTGTVDGFYFECTYNGLTGEIYVDTYIKDKNEAVDLGYEHN